MHQAEHNNKNVEADVRLVIDMANRLFTASACDIKVDYSIARMVISLGGFIVSYKLPKTICANDTPRMLTCGW